MDFSEEEIRRLMEFSDWGILKGIQDESLKSANKKLHKLIRYRTDAKVFLEDPERQAQAGNGFLLEKTVSLTEKYLKRAVTPNETRVIIRIVNEGLPYADIFAAYEKCVSETHTIDLAYIENELFRP